VYSDKIPVIVRWKEVMGKIKKAPRHILIPLELIGWTSSGKSIS
jgi:hypothetical protein